MLLRFSVAVCNAPTSSLGVIEVILLIFILRTHFRANYKDAKSDELRRADWPVNLLENKFCKLQAAWKASDTFTE